MISKTFYGTLPDGRDVHTLSLRNSNGMQVDIITYGATVTRILVPDRNNNFGDVVLGYDTLDKYIDDEFYLGAAIGRFANRIARGRFVLNGKEYNLPLNNNGNHLHGGPGGLQKVLWNILPANDYQSDSVKLNHISKDGEGGYPGELNVSAVFSLNESNELAIHFEASSDKPTILNLAHHSYFNLSGNPSSSIDDHQLEINADAYTPIMPNGIPAGSIDKTENTPMDFRSAKKVGERIGDNFDQLTAAGGYDHNYVLNGGADKITKSASLYEPFSGRYMELFTDQPGLQLYTGNFLKDTAGKDGIVFRRRSGLCLETQNFPDAPNHSNFPSAVLNEGELYSKTTVYKFSVKQ